MQAVRNIDHRVIDTLAPRPAAGERRGTVQAMAAWTSLTGYDGIPALAELLGRRRVIAAQEFLLKTDPISRLSVFIICGDALRAILGGPILGATFWDCMPRAVRDTLSQACAAAMKQGAPIHQAGAFEAEAGVEIRYRGIFMPLRSLGRAEPGYLFGAYGSRAFEAMTPAAAE